MCKAEGSKHSGISNSEWEAWPPLRAKRQKEETALSLWELNELELCRRNFLVSGGGTLQHCRNAESKQEGPRAEGHALASPSPPRPPGFWWVPLWSRYNPKQRARNLRMAAHRFLPSGIMWIMSARSQVGNNLPRCQKRFSL